MFCEFLAENRNRTRKFEFSKNHLFPRVHAFPLVFFFKFEILNLFLISPERKLLIFS